ncbi:hypothetical protein AMECASPLE_016727 [Ameca splendens]|uniref:Uncharacterized protein n=1 Tax=Ameca splendens TaxID=208324 RepID=A0ABV0YDB1_9TELE
MLDSEVRVGEVPPAFQVLQDALLLNFPTWTQVILTFKYKQNPSCSSNRSRLLLLRKKPDSNTIHYFAHKKILQEFSFISFGGVNFQGLNNRVLKVVIAEITKIS